MTDKQPNDDRRRLEALYHEQADVQPDAGLDWRIRAQAHREARRSNLPRPAHWLSGGAVAASLFVVVAVVTQMESPRPEFPETLQSRPDSASNNELQAPSPAAERKMPAEGVRHRSAPTMSDRAADDSFEPAPPPAASLMTEPNSDAQASSDRLIEEERARALEKLARDRVPLDPELGFSEARRTGLSENPSEESQRRLWLIERFVALGQPEKAREAIEAYRDRFPDRVIPVRLIDAVEALEAGGSQG